MATAFLGIGGNVMIRLLRRSAILVFAFACAVSPGSASRAADACDLVTKSEVEAAFDGTFNDGVSKSEGDATYCSYFGDDMFIFIVMVSNAALPPGLELAAWRAQHKASVQKACQDVPGGAQGAVFQIVPDLGEEAYVCGSDSHIGPVQVGGTTSLHAAKGPNIVQIDASSRAPEMLEKLSNLVRTAFSRLPQ